MKIISINSSKDDLAKKVLQQTYDNYIVETGVFDDKETVHLCISSQIGCPIGCKMCYNGLEKKFYRNLNSNEIIMQVENIIQELNLTNLYNNIWFSFMGVGEPLLNIKNVLTSIVYLQEKYKNSFFALATTIPNYKSFDELLNAVKYINNFKLTISLHSAIDEKRKLLIPTHSSLKELRECMEKFKSMTNHKCEWNYVLLKDFNDHNLDYDRLLKFLKYDDRIKISTYNPIELGVFSKSTQERYEILHNLLNSHNIYNSKFESVGDSIDVGCGQMAAKRLEKIRRN